MLDTATVETLEERITEMVTENIITAQEEVEEKVKEDSVEDPTYEIYKPVLDAYYDVLIGEKTSEQQDSLEVVLADGSSVAINEVIRTECLNGNNYQLLQEVGYIFEDLDQDGILELIVGFNDNAEWQKNMVLNQENLGTQIDEYESNIETMAYTPFSKYQR